MSRFEMASDRTFQTPALAEERISAFLRSVYGWMCVGLGITAVTAFVIAASPDVVLAIARNRLLFWGLMIAQLGLVFTLSARVDRMSPGLASILFIAYSALTGVTMSFVLLAFTATSVGTTFVVTAGMYDARGQGEGPQRVLEAVLGAVH